VAAFARAWQDEYRVQQQTSGRGTFVPLSFAPGEAFQFDWSEDWAIIDGVRTKLQVAHFKLSYSRAFFVRAYILQTHEMLFDAHNHAFRMLGGVPRRGIYDNMRTAIDKVGRGKAPRLHRVNRPPPDDAPADARAHLRHRRRIKIEERAVHRAADRMTGQGIRKRGGVEVCGHGSPCARGMPNRGRTPAHAIRGSAAAPVRYL
jgi:transposase